MKHPERAIQQQIVQTLRQVGGWVWELGTTRSTRDFHMGTRQTPGLPDVIAFLPVKGDPHRCVQLIVECKAPGGRLRHEQAVFQLCCQQAQVAHVVGDLDAVLAWLIAHGYVKSEQVPHYRRPAAESECS